MFWLMPALLTSIILRWHWPVQDLFEGIQPLSLFSLLLAHEDKLSLGCRHHNTTLPFVSPGMLWDILLNRVAFALCADENYPQLLCVLHTYNKDNSLISNIIVVKLWNSWLWSVYNHCSSARHWVKKEKRFCSHQLAFEVEQLPILRIQNKPPLFEWLLLLFKTDSIYAMLII